MRKRSHSPLDPAVVERYIGASGIHDMAQTSIRELVRLSLDIEGATGTPFIHMEMGIPGLATPDIGVDAQISALTSGVSSRYAMIDGLPELKDEASRFAQLFLNIQVPPSTCIPVVGSMQGSMATFMVANRNNHLRRGTLFIDPGFPVQKQQCAVLGHDYETFDVYNYRGPKLRAKLESYLERGLTSSILYSNPNNPTWVCLSDDELKIIGELSRKYDVTVIEDLAYFGMDFRRDYSRPGEPPYQPTAAHYTDNYVILLSTSKAFSYAGERMGIVMVSDSLFHRRYPDLLRYYTSDQFGRALVYGALYALTAGVGHSAQYGAAAILRAVNDGEYNFVEGVSDYGERAKVMKRLMLENGFSIVYDRDDTEPLADGFYFTFAYPGLTGGELLSELLYYGISAIALAVTGSEHREGLRACVSQFSLDQAELLQDRLERFSKDHPI